MTLFSDCALFLWMGLYEADLQASRLIFSVEAIQILIIVSPKILRNSTIYLNVNNNYFESLITIWINWIFPLPFSEFKIKVSKFDFRFFFDKIYSLFNKQKQINNFVIVYVHNIITTIFVWGLRCINKPCREYIVMFINASFVYYYFE